MQIKYIPPHELKNYWEFVKNGIEKGLLKSPDNYIQEEVFASCYMQKSMLWIFYENDLEGFTVLTPDGDNLFVWIIWGKTPQSKETAKECFNMIKGIAKQGGAKTITFGSHRLGWDKVARQLGFTPRLWEMKIEE